MSKLWNGYLCSIIVDPELSYDPPMDFFPNDSSWSHTFRTSEGLIIGISFRCWKGANYLKCKVLNDQSRIDLENHLRLFLTFKWRPPRIIFVCPTATNCQAFIHTKYRLIKFLISHRSWAVWPHEIPKLTSILSLIHFSQLERVSSGNTYHHEFSVESELTRAATENAIMEYKRLSLLSYVASLIVQDLKSFRIWIFMNVQSFKWPKIKLRLIFDFI